MVKFSFGTIAVGQTVTATVTAQALEDGTLTQLRLCHQQRQSDAEFARTIPRPRPRAVSEPPIVVSAPITVSGKNQNNIQVATFTHANGVEPASDFVATINWGDGSTSTGTITLSAGTYKVKGSHTYSANGSHTVTTTIVEAGSSPNVAMAMATMTSSAQPAKGARPPRVRRTRRLRPVRRNLSQPLSMSRS